MGVACGPQRSHTLPLRESRSLRLKATPYSPAAPWVHRVSTRWEDHQASANQSCTLRRNVLWPLEGSSREPCTIPDGPLGHDSTTMEVGNFGSAGVLRAVKSMRLTRQTSALQREPTARCDLWARDTLTRARRLKPRCKEHRGWMRRRCSSAETLRVAALPWPMLTHGPLRQPSVTTPTLPTRQEAHDRMPQSANHEKILEWRVGTRAVTQTRARNRRTTLPTMGPLFLDCYKAARRPRGLCTCRVDLTCAFTFRPNIQTIRSLFSAVIFDAWCLD